jgi:hypothetical protein
MIALAISTAPIETYQRISGPPVVSFDVGTHGGERKAGTFCSVHIQVKNASIRQWPGRFGPALWILQRQPCVP